MFPNAPLWLKIVLSLAIALGVSYFTTPYIKTFAERVGAMDVPKDDRRVHDHPIPRMGGLAIFLGIVVAVSVMVFDEVSPQVLGLLIGSIIIAVMGAVDDIVNLKALVKLAVQIVAAIIAIRSGILFDAVSSLRIDAENTSIAIGWLSAPLTLLWIVGCTNAVNLIDGLDGLAAGVSAISSFTMLIVACFVAEPVCAVILAAVAGACLGFLPYNKNPAVIFMGDVGSQLLGFVLACVSVMGMFKFHAIITFFVPILALALPLADTAFAFCRRILHGQSPFKADKKHFHHRLLAMGLSQKQVAAVLYAASAILGLIAVLLAGGTALVRIICLVISLLIAVTVWLFVFRKSDAAKSADAPEAGEETKE